MCKLLESFTWSYNCLPRIYYWVTWKHNHLLDMNTWKYNFIRKQFQTILTYRQKVLVSVNVYVNPKIQTGWHAVKINLLKPVNHFTHTHTHTHTYIYIYIYILFSSLFYFYCFTYFYNSGGVKKSYKPCIKMGANEKKCKALVRYCLLCIEEKVTLSFLQ